MSKEGEEIRDIAQRVLERRLRQVPSMGVCKQCGIQLYEPLPYEGICRYCYGDRAHVYEAVFLAYMQGSPGWQSSGKVIVRSPQEMREVLDAIAGNAETCITERDKFAKGGK